MRIEPLTINNQAKLVQDYRKNDERITGHFDYAPFGEGRKRLIDLYKRSYQRDGLTEVLHSINAAWGAPESTMQNIGRIKKADSVVVVGGQQAGLLTGPLYTVNKVISIIHHAREQERELGVPVIPVFWIAGEDHDFEEINHVFLPETGRMRKYPLSYKNITKSPVSALELDKRALTEWVDALFGGMRETEYTKELYDGIREHVRLSENYSEFFARTIFQLFEEEGLVLIDSSHHLVRQLEKDYFKELIRYQPEIAKGVVQSLQSLDQSGYSVALDAENTDGHLFYHLHGDRILLRRNESGEWTGKQNEITLTNDEMLAIAERHPQLLSNNVVSRPLMQEMLLPTLGFIAGPGEIAYWAALKPAFHALGLRMPPVLPRMSFTLIDERIAKLLHRYGIVTEEAVNYGVAEIKDAWLREKSDPQVEELAESIKESIKVAHEPLRELAAGIRSDIRELGMKNLQHLYRDIDFMRDRILRVLKEMYHKELQEFDTIHTFLQPDGGLQERKFTPIYWMNEYGRSFVKELLHADCSMEEGHYIVYI